MDIEVSHNQDDNEVCSFTPSMRKTGDWIVEGKVYVKTNAGVTKATLDASIKSIHVLEQEDVRGLDMPLWECDVTLVNVDGTYDIDNPNGMIGTEINGVLDKGSIAVGMIVYPYLKFKFKSSSASYFSSPRAYFYIDHIDYGEDEVTLVCYDRRITFQRGCAKSGTDDNESQVIWSMLEANVGDKSIHQGKYYKAVTFPYTIPKYPNDEDCKERALDLVRCSAGVGDQMGVLLPYFLKSTTFIFTSEYSYVLCGLTNGTEIEIYEDQILDYPKKIDTDSYGQVRLTATFSDGSTASVIKSINSTNSNILSLTTSLFKTVSPPSDSTVTNYLTEILGRLTKYYTYDTYEAEVIDIPDVDVGKAIILHAKYTTLLGHITYVDTTYDGEVRTRFRFILDGTTDKDPTVTTSTLTAGRISGTSKTFSFSLTEGFHEITINSLSLYNVLSKSTFTPAYKWEKGNFCPYVSMPTSAGRGDDFSITLSGYFEAGDHTLKIFADEYTDIMYGYLYFTVSEASS